MGHYVFYLDLLACSIKETLRRVQKTRMWEFVLKSVVGAWLSDPARWQTAWKWSRAKLFQLLQDGESDHSSMSTVAMILGWCWLLMPIVVLLYCVLRPFGCCRRKEQVALLVRQGSWGCRLLYDSWLPEQLECLRHWMNVPEDHVVSKPDFGAISIAHRLPPPSAADKAAVLQSPELLFRLTQMGVRQVDETREALLFIVEDSQHGLDALSSRLRPGASSKVLIVPFMYVKPGTGVQHIARAMSSILLKHLFKQVFCAHAVEWRDAATNRTHTAEFNRFKLSPLEWST
jgi:hypothetical protein